MDQHNKDVLPSPVTCDVYPLVQALIRNELIDSAFRAREAAANNIKNRYHLLGRIGIVCVMAGAVFVLGEAMFARTLVIPPLLARYITVSISVVTAAGLAMQIFLMVTGQKQLWLNNRFAAERLRSIKFQAYALAVTAADSHDLAVKVGAFYTREMALLENELNAAKSVLRTFSPHLALARQPHAFAARNPELAREAADAYAELRIRYQVRFAADEVEKLQSGQRLDYEIADILYLTGASFSVAALICKIFAPLWADAIEFVAVSAFIAGLGKTLMDNASLGEESRMRYLDYQQALEAAQEGDDALPVRISKVERAALEELHQFCKSASRVSYRL